MYLYAVTVLAQNGYEQYEISNFAKPGFASRHNLKYWHMEEYAGFGPAPTPTSAVCATPTSGTWTAT